MRRRENEGADAQTYVGAEPVLHEGLFQTKLNIDGASLRLKARAIRRAPMVHHGRPTDCARLEPRGVSTVTPGGCAWIAPPLRVL